MPIYPLIYRHAWREEVPEKLRAKLTNVHAMAGQSSCPNTDRAARIASLIESARRRKMAEEAVADLV